MTITALPTPPSRDDPSNFAARGDAFLAALPDFVTEANALATTLTAAEANAVAQASAASTSATNSASSASSAATSASNASTSATAANNSASSASSHASSASSSAGAAASSASAASTSAATANTKAAEASASAAAASAIVLGVSTTLPSMRPSLLLDFANSRAVDGRITFTRASTATRVNPNGLIESVASGVPRIDFDPITLACKGLLVEESRTNLLTYSEDFSNGVWAGTNVTVGANATTAPDGTSTADSLTRASNAPSYLSLTAGISVTNATHTVSVYAKAKATGGNFGLSHQTTYGDRVNAIFNLNTGAIAAGPYTPGGSVSSAYSAAITHVGNGWYRCSLTALIPAGASYRAYFGPTAEASTSDNWNVASATLSDCYVWGAQLEAGAFPTSYIPTTSAQVTRAADVATMTGANFSSWYRQDEGSFIAVSDQYVTGNSNQCIVFEAGDGTNANLVQLGTQYGTTNFQYLINQAGSSQAAVVTAASTSQTARAVSYKTNDCAQSINGAAVSTDTAATMPIVASFGVGCKVNQISQLNGHIARIAYYPKRLTNTELQAITA